MNPTSTKKKRKSSLKTTKEIKVQIALGTLEADAILKALRSKKTPGDIIEMLDKIKLHRGGFEPYENAEKRALIAKHPNTPISVLTSIFQRRDFMENPHSIRCEDASILSHPSFPAKLLLEVFNKITYDSYFRAEYSYLFKVIENPNFPTDLLESLAKHKNTIVRYYVAQHPNTPPKILELLSTDATQHRNYWDPQHQVAANINTPPYVLKTLSTTQRIVVRNRVANNLKTPMDTLKAMIANDRSLKARATALYTLYKLGKITFTDK